MEVSVAAILGSAGANAAVTLLGSSDYRSGIGSVAVIVMRL